MAFSIFQSTIRDQEATTYIFLNRNYFSLEPLQI